MKDRDQDGALPVWLSVIKWGMLGVVAVLILAGGHCGLWELLGERIYQRRRDALVDALVEANPQLDSIMIETDFFVSPWRWLVETDPVKRAELWNRISFLPGIRHVTIHCRYANDIAPLAGMRLRSLDLSGTRVMDIASLAGMPLEDLDLAGTWVVDLSPLVGMPLKSLSLSGSRVRDLTPLAGMQLEELRLVRSQVRDLTSLAGMPLRWLDLERTEIADLTPLAGMPLESLDLMYTPVIDLEPLKGMPLKYLSISDTPAADLTLPDWLPPGCEVWR